jgi:hypothetical protein
MACLSFLPPLFAQIARPPFGAADATDAEDHGRSRPTGRQRSVRNPAALPAPQQPPAGAVHTGHADGRDSDSDTAGRDPGKGASCCVGSSTVRASCVGSGGALRAATALLATTIASRTAVYFRFVTKADARLGRGRFVGGGGGGPITGSEGVSSCFRTGGLQFNGCLVCRARRAALVLRISTPGAPPLSSSEALAVRPLCRQDSAPLTAAALRCRRCSAEREGAANANRCNPGYEFEAYSAECGGGEGCVSVRPCATGVTAEIPHTCNYGYTYNPSLPIYANCPTGCVNQAQQCDPNPNTGFSAGAQRVCMQNGQPALQYTVGMCQDAGVSLFGQATTTVPNPEGCYFASTPRSCDRTPTAGPAAGHISDQAQASPRKFNGGGDYVMISQNKLGTYCDVTIDTWIKFGANALAQDQCPTLGAGWVRGSGNIAYDCPGAVRKSTATLIARTHPPLDTSPDRSSDAASWLRCCGRIWAMSTVSIAKQLRRSAAKCR